MAAPYNPPKKNEDFILYVALRDVNDPKSFKVNPTIAAGDFKVKKDTGVPTNLTNLPAVDNAAEIWLKISLTSTEMNADTVCIQGIDATAVKEWSDFALYIPTTQ